MAGEPKLGGSELRTGWRIQEQVVELGGVSWMGGSGAKASRMEGAKEKEGVERAGSAWSEIEAESSSLREAREQLRQGIERERSWLRGARGR